MRNIRHEIALDTSRSKGDVMPFQVGQKVDLTDSPLHDLRLLPKEGVIVGTGISVETGQFVYLVEVATDDFGGKTTIEIPPDRIFLLEK